jgi:hypothetical protein
LGLSFSDTGQIGSMGPAFLSPSVPSAVVEIDVGRGAALAPAARTAIAETLRRSGNKTSVTYARSHTVPAQRTYSEDDFRQLQADYRATTSNAKSVSVYVLVLPGQDDDGNALGVPFGASSFAIFPQRIRSVLPAGSDAERFEQAVAVNELGHLFGLVNVTGKGSFHEDPTHPGHARDRSSVRYWAVEDIAIARVFGNSPPIAFDAADRAEMARIREAAR